MQPGFRLVLDEFECTNVCFWFIPPSLRGQEENEEWWNKIHTVSNIKTKTVNHTGMEHTTVFFPESFQSISLQHM